MTLRVGTALVAARLLVFATAVVAVPGPIWAQTAAVPARPALTAADYARAERMLAAT
ncbi:MAG: hypothetical protein IT181_21970, partial [Acidobacteria bacterium]|nr:hypothetical protein [Acidobacteriota bacterium]